MMGWLIDLAPNKIAFSQKLIFHLKYLFKKHKSNIAKFRLTR
jgi:hypothetical protein